MEVEDAEVVAVGADDDELGDAVVAHEVEGVDGIVGVEDAFGVGAHDVGGGEAVDVFVDAHHAAEVAVGDDAEDALAVAFRLHDDGAAEAFGGHLEDGFADGGDGGNGWALVLLVEVGDAHVELLAQGAAGVEACKVAGAEVAAFDEGHGQGVAHDELGGGAAGGCEVVGAGLVLHGGVEDDVGVVGEEGVGVAHHGDEFVAEAAEERDEDFNFGGVAAFGEAHDHVALLHHAEVAVDGVGGMHEEGRSAGAVEGGNDLGGDVCALSNTRNYDSSRGRKNGFDGLKKAFIEPVFQIVDSFFFFFNNLNGNILYFFLCLQCHFFFVN